MLKKKKVNEVMTKDVLTTTPEEEVVFAFEKLMKYKISALPVVDESGEMVGIVTATDLGHNLILDNYKLGTKVANAMVEDVVSVGPEESLSDVVSLMNEGTSEGSIVNQLPVLKDNKLVGIISDGDIIRVLK